MKQKFLHLLSFLLLATLFSCSDEESYMPVANDELTAKPGRPGGDAPVSFDLTQVPLPKLSDYHFFVGALKNQTPNYLVIPYRPASELFSDYAHKKRFVWMPKGMKATYNGDDNVLELPVGAAILKTFFYDNVAPGNVTKIIETRLLIRIHSGVTGDSGWKMYDYIWNDSQTEAYLDTDGNGVFVPVTFTENSVTRSITYKIPATTECNTCHKLNEAHVAGGEIKIPIGIKPQNLNNSFNYGNVVRNQLLRWKQAGYIDNTLPALASINATVDWRDTSKPLETRARSYIDINCAHCHRTGGHCDYVAMRFNFSNTDLGTFGVCMVPSAVIDDGPFVINAGRPDRSEMIIRMSSVEESVMMPIIGRTIVHDEGVQLMKDWISSLTTSCQ